MSSIRERGRFPDPRLSWLAPRDKLESVKLIGRYRGPLLQSHGDRDRTSPYASGQKLFRAANEPKIMVTITGAHHNNWLTDEYLQRFEEFVKRAAPDRK